MKLKVRLTLFALALIFTYTLVFIFAEGLSSKREESFAEANEPLPAWVAGSIANGIPF